MGNWRIYKLGLRRSTLSQISMSSRSVGWQECGLLLFISEIIPESMPASVCCYDLLLQVVDMGVSLNGGSFLVGKPMVVGYHHFRKPPYFYVLSLCRGFHPADFLVREDADRATVTFADHSVREALLVGAEPDCYLAEVIIPRYPSCFFCFVWCKHVAFANLCLVCVFLTDFVV